MLDRFPVEVDADQFDRLAKPTQPLAGVAELVWNALDAEADSVVVSIVRSELDAVQSLSVTDDGHGMTHDEAKRDFKTLGGSWKKSQAQSKSGKRTLHGKEGAGRFRAFAIGRKVEWSSTAANANGALERTAITGSLDDSQFTVSAPESLSTGDPGTKVEITVPRGHAGKLLGDNAVPWLVTRFAVYLLKYPGITVTYDGTTLDPATITDRTATIELDPSLGGDREAPKLQILEWSSVAKTITPSLVLCDENGVALHEIIDGIETVPDIRFTAYLTWSGFAEHAAELEIVDLGNPVLTPIMDAARDAIRNYLRTRENEKRSELIDRWKAEAIYPYSGDASNSAEIQERKMFDVVAAAAAPAVSGEKKAAKLSLNLIKEALAQPPGALHRVLTEVLDLTPEQLADFDQLLERTSLTSIIHTSKLVTDRLDFLVELESMLFDPDKKENLLERSQLHRVLANGKIWIFGEQYALAVDDRGLTKVLQAHRQLMEEPSPAEGAVTDSEGQTRIVDLMLSRADNQANHRKHLVVELKRPSVKLSQKELGQITNYAVAVTQDERFDHPHVTWDFWLLGDSIDESVKALTTQKNQPAGLYAEGSNYRIWVRQWAEVIEESRQRLHFYRDHLDFVPPEDELELDSVVEKYLTPVDTTRASRAE